METMHAVSVHGLSQTFGAGAGEVRALDGVDPSIPAGMFTAIMSPSGSGKSTCPGMAAERLIQSGAVVGSTLHTCSRWV